nr:hypothetical protein [Tanacetum cinerariifolium]
MVYALKDPLTFDDLMATPIDFSKPLPLQGHPGHLTVAANYFFNNDHEYLKSSDSEKTYTTSITNIKATRYEIEGIEYMVPMLWSPTKVGSQLNKFSKNNMCSTKKILGVKSVSVKKLHEYGHLEEIGRRELTVSSTSLKKKRVMRADKLYKFSEWIIKNVRDELHYRIRDFRLEYNTEMPSRKWTTIDRKRSELMVGLINKKMRERMIIQNHERSVGSIELEMD